MNKGLQAWAVLALVCCAALLVSANEQDDAEDASTVNLDENHEETDVEMNKLIKRRLQEALGSNRAETKTSTLRLERDHLKAIGFEEQDDNPCLRVRHQ
jgi:hypothetical protein